MDKQNIEGGLAFPLTDALMDHKFWGMTLRDYFAAQVLSTLIKDNPNAVRSGGAENYAKNAYQWADIMIKMRENGSSVATK